MRKTVLLALAAAAAIVPAMASAQDRGWHGRHGGDSSASQPQDNNGGRRGRDNSAATPAPAPQPSNDGRYGSWAGRNAGRDGSFSTPVDNRQAQAQAMAQAQARAQAQAQAQSQARTLSEGRNRAGGWNRQGGNDAGRYGSWAGRNAGPDGSFSGQSAYGQARPQGGSRSNGGNTYRNGSNYGNRGGGAWNRDWRGSNQYNWQSYRSSNRNAFRLPRYYAPYGWNYGYRRFGIGSVIESLLFNQSYWIDDPYDYRLPDAYGEYRWVRYYNDALLVDIYSGEVVDVVYDIFY